jgi:hypothetical protein
MQWTNLRRRRGEGRVAKEELSLHHFFANPAKVVGAQRARGDFRGLGTRAAAWRDGAQGVSGVEEERSGRRGVRARLPGRAAARRRIGSLKRLKGLKALKSLKLGQLSFQFSNKIPHPTIYG